MHQAQQFLEVLWQGQFDDLGLWICAFSPGESPIFKFHQSGASLVADVNERQDRDIHCSIGGMSRRPMSGRGITSDVTAIPALWADFDVKEGSFDTKRKIYQFVDDLPLAPTMLVDSGGGVHAYWVLREPWWLDDDRELARRTLKGWARFLSTTSGVKLDAVSDLARVMRLPGTLNHKGGTPMEATIVPRDVGPLYNPSDFEMYIAEEIWEPGVAEVKFSGQEFPDLAQNLMRNDEKFTKIWNKQGNHADKTPSGVCMTLANYMVQGAILTDDQIRSVLVAWRGQNGAKPKPDSWYARTIGKARAGQSGASETVVISDIASSIQKAHVEIQEAIDSGADDTAHLEDQIQEQRRRFLRTLEGYYGIEFDEMTVVEHFNEKTGRVEGGELRISINGRHGAISIEHLSSQNAFRKAVLRTMLVNLRRLPNDDWATVSTAILTIAGREEQEEDLKPGQTEIQIVMNFLADSFETNDPAVLLTTSTPTYYKDDDGVQWFTLAGVLRYARMAHGEMLSKRMLARALKDHGGISKTHNVKREAKRWTTTTLWTTT